MFLSLLQKALRSQKLKNTSNSYPTWKPWRQWRRARYLQQHTVCCETKIKTEVNIGVQGNAPVCLQTLLSVSWAMVLDILQENVKKSSSMGVHQPVCNTAENAALTINNHSGLIWFAAGKLCHRNSPLLPEVFREGGITTILAFLGQCMGVFTGHNHVDELPISERRALNSFLRLHFYEIHKVCLTRTCKWAAVIHQAKGKNNNSSFGAIFPIFPTRNF